MYSEIATQIDGFDPISLKEMKTVKLMNRTDTKYVMSVATLQKFIRWARHEYFAQEIDGVRLSKYHTIYYDTADKDMYMMHHRGHSGRQKVRVRTYCDSDLRFLEIKHKNNRGRTKKKRISLTSVDDATSPEAMQFVSDHSRYMMESLSQHVENTFTRITLVNRAKTERLTIDLNLKFHNILTGTDFALNNVAIIEVKRDGRTFSPATSILRQLHQKPCGFSKYCMGSALTDPGLRQSRFRPRLRKVMRLEHSA